MPEDRPLVADSGPLIALASIEQLHLLERLYSAVLVPSAVMREVVEAGRGRPGSREVQAAAWIARVELDSPPDAYLVRELGAGEAEVITLAHRRAGAVALLDEREARRIATLVYGLPVQGTVGTLVRAKRRGLLPAVRPLCESLRASGYYLATALVERVCRELGE